MSNAIGEFATDLSAAMGALRVAMAAFRDACWEHWSQEQRDEFSFLADHTIPDLHDAARNATKAKCSVCGSVTDTPGIDVEELLESVRDQTVLRAFACRCVRQVWHLLTDERSRAAVETAERYARGDATEAELAAAEKIAQDAKRAVEDGPCSPHHEALHKAVCRAAAAAAATADSRAGDVPDTSAWHAAYAASRHAARAVAWDDAAEWGRSAVMDVAWDAAHFAARAAQAEMLRDLVNAAACK